MMVLTIVFCIQKNSASVQLHVPLSVMIIFKAIMMIKSKSFLWGHFPGIRHILPTILDKLKVSYFSRLITPIPGYDDDEESRREGVKTAMDFDSDEVQWHKSRLFFLFFTLKRLFRLYVIRQAWKIFWIIREISYNSHILGKSFTHSNFRGFKKHQQKLGIKWERKYQEIKCQPKGDFF